MHEKNLRCQKTGGASYDFYFDKLTIETILLGAERVVVQAGERREEGSLNY